MTKRHHPDLLALISTEGSADRHTVCCGKSRGPWPTYRAQLCTAFDTSARLVLPFSGAFCFCFFIPLLALYYYYLMKVSVSLSLTMNSWQFSWPSFPSAVVMDINCHPWHLFLLISSAHSVLCLLLEPPVFLAPGLGIFFTLTLPSLVNLHFCSCTSALM